MTAANWKSRGKFYTINNKKVDSYLVRSMNDYYNKTPWKVINTREKIYGCINKAFSVNNDRDIVYNSLMYYS